jgi:hypothetical protein
LGDTYLEHRPAEVAEQLSRVAGAQQVRQWDVEDELEAIAVAGRRRSGLERAAQPAERILVEDEDAHPRRHPRVCVWQARPRRLKLQQQPLVTWSVGEQVPQIGR